MSFDIPSLTNEEIEAFEQSLDEAFSAKPAAFKSINSDGLDRDKERLLRMATVVSKFASTLAARHITVHVDETNQYPTEAWSDADNIWFNQAKIKDLTDPEVVAGIKGLALHEISHILLTPRAGSNIVKWAKQNDYMRAFNALEDQRIETFMTHRFSNVDDWLVSTVAKYLLNEPAAIPVAFVLTHGRKYLPQELRDMLQSQYASQEDVAELSRIIDNYTVLNLSDSNHIPIAQQLIGRYHELVIATTNPDTPKRGWDGIPDPNGHDKTPNMLKSSEKSKPMNKAGQDTIIKKVLAKRAAQSQQPSSGDQEIEEYEPTDEQGKDGKDGKRGDGYAKQGDNGDNPITDGEDVIGGTAGNGGESDVDDVREVIQRTLNKSIQNLREDLKNTIKQFSGDVELTGKSIPVPPKSYIHNQPVSPEVVNASRSFSKELALIKADYDPGWNRRVEQGRLNVQRYVTGCDVDEAFDEWDMGREDAVDIECVVLLDTSGSMSWTINEAYDSMWAIKRGMDKVGAATTVLTFASDAKILYNANEQASHMKRYGGVGGGTSPDWAMKHARNIFAESTRAIKILITITDGEWWGTDTDDNIKLLRSSGVVTALAFVDDAEHNASRYPEVEYYQQQLLDVKTINSHGAEVTHKVNNASDLFELARKLVRVGIVRNLGI
jgi:hypothetical protein